MEMDATRKAHAEGMSLGASIENRIAISAIATAALAILGKDRADGIIDLGALGRWLPNDNVTGGPAEWVSWHTHRIAERKGE